MPTYHQHSRGFTLVELSIVLVIIGLIVGGIVGGQALVSSARIQSITKDMSKYHTAIRAFELQYDALPGDFAEAEDYWGSVAGSCWTSAGAGTQTCNGDGDGIVDYDSYVSTVNWRDSSYESWRTWEHLQNAEIISGNFTGTPTNSVQNNSQNQGYTPGTNAPSGAINNSFFAFFYVGNGITWTGDRNRHVLIFGTAEEGTNPGRWYNAILTPAQANSIDKKIDDGKPYTGKITDILNSNGTNLYTPNCTDSETAKSAKYNLSLTTAECVLMLDY